MSTPQTQSKEFPGSDSPLAILQAARKAVPAVDYALGAAGVAAAAAIVIALLGHGRATAIVLGGMLVAMVLLFVFARLIAARNRSIVQAGVVLLWCVTLFFCVFLAFTITAVAFAWPPAWTQVLGLSPPVPPSGERAQGKTPGDGRAVTTGPCSPVVTGGGATSVTIADCKSR